MGNRRMFSKSVCHSARFLRMPVSSRDLYFNLGLEADDEGIVEAFSVMRLVGSTEDDLRVLVAKGFVQILNEDLVTYITDWKENNLIRSDRFQPSRYHELLVKMQSSDTVGIPNDNQVTTKRIPTGYQMDTEVKLSKDKLSKDKRSKENTIVEVVDDKDLWFSEFWKLYPRKVAKANAEKAFKKKCKSESDYTAIMRGLQNYIKSCKGKDSQYIAHPATWINGERWNDEESSGKSGNAFLNMLSEMEE